MTKRSGRQINIPGLGLCVEDRTTGWLASELIPIPLLGGSLARVILDGYELTDPNQDFHQAIRCLLEASHDALKSVQVDIYAYYEETREMLLDEDIVEIESPGNVWEHVVFGQELFVSRRSKDGEIYVSLECECAWEPEHGLQIVLRGGRVVTKVGPFDGHLTNADAFGDTMLEGVIYHRINDNP